MYLVQHLVYKNRIIKDTLKTELRAQFNEISTAFQALKR